MNKPKKTKGKTTLRNKADKLFSAKIRARGACEMCGKKTDTLQCAHVITRSHLRTRYMEENALCLCAGCHLFWHHEPLQAINWFNGVYKERADKLLKERQVLEKNFDYQQIIDKYASNP